MIRFLLTFMACTAAASLPAIVPAALGQNQAQGQAMPPVADEGPRVAGPTPVAYACAAERGFSVVYNAGESADLLIGDSSFTLKQLQSGSGFRYSDGTVTLAGKGKEAMLEGAPDGVYRDCIARERP